MNSNYLELVVYNCKKNITDTLNEFVDLVIGFCSTTEKKKKIDHCGKYKA